MCSSKRDIDEYCKSITKIYTLNLLTSHQQTSDERGLNLHLRIFVYTEVLQKEASALMAKDFDEFLVQPREGNQSGRSLAWTKLECNTTTAVFVVEYCFFTLQMLQHHGYFQIVTRVNDSLEVQAVSRK